MFSLIFNDRFYLSFFVAMHGFRESGFDCYWSLYLSAQKCRPCVYISMPLWYQRKVVQRAWSMVQVFIWTAEKTRFNTCANNKGADQSAHPRLRIRADWSAPLFFAVACFVFFFFKGEASHKLKWKAKWFSGMYKFLIESIITGLFSPLIQSKVLSYCCWVNQ